MSLATQDFPTYRPGVSPGDGSSPRPGAPEVLDPSTASADPSSSMKRGRLLILAPKGLGRLDGMYQELGRLGWQTRMAEIDDRAICYVSRALGLRPTLAGHRRAYERWNSRLARTQLAFDYRTRSSARVLAGLDGQVDCVLQIGGMWAPAFPPNPIPYTLFCDSTVRLADREPFCGVEFGSPQSAQRWYRRERELYQRAKAIFTASDYARRSLIDDYGVPDERVSIVGYGINLKAPE